jgi:hypothetical protein
MLVELTPQEREELIHLVNVALRDIGPEIRHTRTWDYKEDLKAHRRFLRTLHAHLVSSLDAGKVSESHFVTAGMVESS